MVVIIVEMFEDDNRENTNTEKKVYGLFTDKEEANTYWINAPAMQKIVSSSRFLRHSIENVNLV